MGRSTSALTASRFTVYFLPIFLFGFLLFSARGTEFITLQLVRREISSLLFVSVLSGAFVVTLIWLAANQAARSVPGLCLAPCDGYIGQIRHDEEWAAGMATAAGRLQDLPRLAIPADIFLGQPALLAGADPGGGLLGPMPAAHSSSWRI